MLFLGFHAPPTSPSHTLTTLLSLTTSYAFFKTIFFHTPHHPSLLLLALADALFLPPLAVTIHVLSYTSSLSSSDLVPARDPERAPLLPPSSSPSSYPAPSPPRSFSSAPDYDDDDASSVASFVSCDTGFDGRSASGSLASSFASSFAYGSPSPANDSSWAHSAFGTPPEHALIGSPSSLVSWEALGNTESGGDKSSSSPDFESLSSVDRETASRFGRVFPAVYKAATGPGAGGWALEEVDGIKVQVSTQNDGMVVARAETIVNAPPARVASALAAWDERSGWDKTFKCAEDLADMGDGYAAAWIAFHAQELTQQRDAAVLSGTSPMSGGKGYIVAYLSTERADCPPLPDYARILIGPSGFVVQPSPSSPNASTVSAIFAIGISGWVPAPVKSRLAASTVASVGSLDAYITSLAP